MWIENTRHGDWMLVRAPTQTLHGKPKYAVFSYQLRALRSWTLGTSLRRKQPEVMMEEIR